MTWKDMTDRLNEVVRDQRAWPDTVTSKLDQQLTYLFGAYLVIGRSLPLDDLFDGYATKLGTVNTGSVYNSSPLPTDIFYLRDDFGIDSLIFDTAIYENPDVMPWWYFQQRSKSSLQAGNVLLSIRDKERKIYFTNSTTIQFGYIPIQPIAVSDSASPDYYSSLTYPLNEPYASQAVQLVAMAVEAELTGNRSKSAIHTVLAEYYGQEPVSPQPVTQGKG